MLRKIGATLAAGLLAFLVLPFLALPASAVDALTPQGSCVYNGPDGTYAVFGYTNTGPELQRSLGSMGSEANMLIPDRFQGKQVTVLKAGGETAAFAIGPLNPGEEASWKLDSKESRVRGNSQLCAEGAALPASGNGLGGIIILAGSALVAGAILFVKHRKAA